MAMVNIVHHTWEEQWIYHLDGKELASQTMRSWVMNDVIQRYGGGNNTAIDVFLSFLISVYLSWK